ncbi:MAG: glycosyltransferase family 4 protein [Candidatus Omnitrophica bacterium]|nr:glycosyltransferase family 4 protein [Candidatus Omnitrophota bacterium]
MKATLKIAYVSSFPPRECGIATFTADLTGALDNLLETVVDSRIAAMNTDAVSRYSYPRQVIFQLDPYSEQDFIRTAEKINKTADIKLVNIQHEFGLFGGKYGSYVLLFLDALKKPSVVTFHSVLPSPNPELYNVVRLIAEKTSGLVAMTHRSKEILIQDYGIDEKKVSVILHGIHSIPYSTSAKSKSVLGFSKKTILLTFGLLSRGKGIEYVIESLPQAVKACPNLMYIVLGVTHPNVLQNEGESYRNSLIEKVRELKLSSHVSFYNEYVSLDKLLQFLRAADIYISTSLDPNQAVSGTLSYALGSGRPVISTPFAQAREIITRQSGILVNFKDPASYTEALLDLLKDPLHREQLGENAYFRTRNMTWDNIALEYSKLFSKYSEEIAEVSKYKKIPRVNLSHLFRLTDDFGIVQFAQLSLPDISSGYTVDDNARALIAACSYYEGIGKAFKTLFPDKKKGDLLKRIEIYLNFIGFVLSKDGLFYNYVKPDRTIDVEFNQKENLEDANSRTFWALAAAATTNSLPENIKQKAFSLLKKSMAASQMVESPRATAFYIKGLCLFKNRKDFQEILVRHCDRLMSLYRGVATEEWQWFETYLTYSNAIFPEALLLGHAETGKSEYLETGIRTLDFLIGQTFLKGIYVPIGQDGWHQKSGERRYFDQQPEDTSAMACALATAATVTGKETYRKLMHQAFNWFLGDNSLKQVVYDRATGGCYDGLGEGQINLNQGAESTISYLLARLAIQHS